MTVDQLNWTSEGIYGGAYNKVIRWSFEKQGDYQSPLVTHASTAFGTVVAAGTPPDVDVYIDDGRHGEYPYQPVHWDTQTIWSRRMADGLEGHQEPALGETNYAYVKIKNRGTLQAQNVVVRGFHTKPGAGLLWPNDFEAFATAQIAVGTVNGNNGEEILVGPFEWTPNINALGHDCMLVIVSADGDPSNIDNFTAGESIPEWRLVPNDNNIGQRNVFPVPGGGGMEGLMESLDGASLWIGNPNPRRATMELKVDLPDVLAKSGWRLTFEGLGRNRFVLGSGQKRQLRLRLQPGRSFTAQQVEASNRDIVVRVFADDNLMGGMTYRLDPGIARPYNSSKPDDHRCRDRAQALLECMGVRGRKVKKTKIKEIIVGIDIADDDGCGDD